MSTHVQRCVEPYYSMSPSLFGVGIAQHLKQSLSKALSIDYPFVAQVQKQLARMDTHCYFSSSAKLVNTWRSSGAAKRIFDTWSHLYGKERAFAVASTLPPRALRGRWGSITRVDDKVLSCGIDELREVFEKTMVGQAKKVETPSENAIREGPEVDESNEDYVAKLGRWTRETLKALRGCKYWLCVNIGRVSRDPVVHLEHFIQSNPDRFIVTLVCEKAHHIFCEFEDLLWNEGRWHQLFNPGCYNDVATEQPQFVELAVACTLELQSDYFLRVLLPCRTFPRLLMWLIYKQPNVPCEERQTCASELLKGRVNGDRTTEKCVAIFARELEHAAKTGLCDEAMWQQLADVADLWIGHTQDIEGINNTIKTVTRIASNIKWPLMSARITSKQWMTGLQTTQDQDNFINRCVELHTAATNMFNSAQEQRDRWAEVHLAREELQQKEKRKASKPTQDEKCGARMILRLKKMLADQNMSLRPGASLGLLLEINDGTRALESIVWIPSLTHRRALWAAPGRLGPGNSESTPNGVVILERPARPRLLLVAMGDAHARAVQLGREADVAILVLGLRWDHGKLCSASVSATSLLMTMHDVCVCHGRGGRRRRRGEEARHDESDEAVDAELGCLHHALDAADNYEDDEAEEAQDVDFDHESHDHEQAASMLEEGRDLIARLSLSRLEDDDAGPHECVLNSALREEIESCVADRRPTIDVSHETREAHKRRTTILETWARALAQTIDALEQLQMPESQSITVNYVSLVFEFHKDDDNGDSVAFRWVYWSPGNGEHPDGRFVTVSGLAQEVGYMHPSTKRNLFDKNISGELVVGIPNTGVASVRARHLRARMKP